MLSSWSRWICVIGAVIVTFWSGLLLGRVLLYGGPDDESVKWGIATALATVVSPVAVLPLVRWAQLPKEH